MGQDHAPPPREQLPRNNAIPGSPARWDRGPARDYDRRKASGGLLLEERRDRTSHVAIVAAPAASASRRVGEIDNISGLVEARRFR